MSEYYEIAFRAGAKCVFNILIMTMTHDLAKYCYDHNNFEPLFYWIQFIFRMQLCYILIVIVVGVFQLSQQNAMQVEPVFGFSERLHQLFFIISIVAFGLCFCYYLMLLCSLFKIVIKFLTWNDYYFHINHLYFKFILLVKYALLHPWKL